MEVQNGRAIQQDNRSGGLTFRAGVWCSGRMDRSPHRDAAMTPDEEYKERIKKAIDKYLRTHETTGGKKAGGGYFEKRRSWKRRVL